MAFEPSGGIVKLSKKGRLVHGEVSRDPKVYNTKTGSYFVKFGVMAGYKDGTEEKQYIDCLAFGRGLASYCKDLAKGDPVCATGSLESNEYNGKTYWSLKLSWVNSPSVVPDVGVPAGLTDDNGEGPGSDGPQFTEVDDDDDEDGLPFK